MKLQIWPFMVILILLSCDPSRISEENIDFDNKIWPAEEILLFEFTVPDADKGYNVFFNLRNTMNYPHYNFYLSYKLKDSLNNILHEELINFDLFDQKTGEPYGQSGLGDIFDHQLPLLENYKFQKRGLKKLELQQFMRYDSLPEIVSVGVRIEKSLP